MNNKKETRAALYGFLIIILLDILFLIFAKRMFAINNIILNSIFLIVIIFSVWKIATLRIFEIEASEHVLSVKYYHPFSKSKKTVLEVPLGKVNYLKIEKKIIKYNIIITIKTRRGIRNFIYRMGVIPQKNIQRLKSISNVIRSARMEFEYQL